MDKITAVVLQEDVYRDIEMKSVNIESGRIVMSRDADLIGTEDIRSKSIRHDTDAHRIDQTVKHVTQMAIAWKAACTPGPHNLAMFRAQHRQR